MDAKPRIHLKPRAGEYGAVSVERRAGAWVETAHRGASGTSRDVAAWMPFKGSADSDLLPEIDALVSRGRDLERNNGIAAGAVRTILDNVVGTGLRLVPDPDYLALGQTKEWAEEFAQGVRSLWNSYYWTTACHASDSLTGDQITRQVHHSYLSNGEALELPLWIKRRDGFNTKMQTIECDRLSNPGSSLFSSAFATPGAPNIRGGVKFDEYGGPVSYFIRNTHPGDRFLSGSFADVSDWTEVPRRFPNGRLRVLHQFDSERSGQSRGKSIFSSVLSTFKQMDRYIEAEIMAAVANAMIAGTITTPMTADQIADLFAADPEKYNRMRMQGRTKIESGTFVPLFPGDKLEAFMPNRPATAFGSFVENILRIIGCALDLPLAILIKDFSKLNYSSYRAAMLEAWRSFSRQRDWLGTMFLDPWFGLWLEEVVNDGRIQVPTDYYANKALYERCRWIGPAKGYVDRTKELEASHNAVAWGLSTLQHESEEQGFEWRALADQQAVERDYYKKLGLPFPGDIKPAASSAPFGGGDSGANTDNADPNATDPASADEYSGAAPPEAVAA